MVSHQFPLEQYLSSLVKLFDSIQYDDQNFDRQERLEHLKHVYAATVKHFQQPGQLETLKVRLEYLEIVMRTSVQVVVYCWCKCPREVMAAISIYYVYIVLLDDSSHDPFPAMATFHQNFFSGNEQKHPFWNLMNGHLPNFLGHYGSFCGFAILRSTFDYFQGCWIETNNFQGFKGSEYFPLFLRRLNGLGGICGGSLFPAAEFDEQALFDQITTAIAEIEPMVAFVNDAISFYKEFDSERDQISLVNNICTVEGVTIPQAFEKIVDMTIASCQRLNNIFDVTKDPKVSETILAFVQGYITWHICDPRFRMREVYDNAPNTIDGEKFRRYYKSAMAVGDYSLKTWAESTELQSAKVEASKADSPMANDQPAVTIGASLSSETPGGSMEPLTV